MKEIKFSDEMFQALLDGRKTQTRRPVRPQPQPVRSDFFLYAHGDYAWPTPGCRGSWMISNKPGGPDGWTERCPYGRAGELAQAKCGDLEAPIEITAVRIERLHAITLTDLAAEGVTGGHGSIPGYMFSATRTEHFTHIWESIYSKKGLGWEANPWVWVIEFERVDK